MLSLQLYDGCSIQPSNVVRDLGVLLGNKLSMSKHIDSVMIFHLRRIRQIKRCLNEHCLHALVQALVLSRIDYCNSLLVYWENLTPYMRRMKTHVVDRAFSAAGPRCWNSFHPGIRFADSVNSFRAQLKMYLFATGLSHLVVYEAPCSGMATLQHHI